MKTIFDKARRNELITRINSLNGNSKANWGKMSVYQMTKHCTIWDEWILGKNDLTHEQSFLGKVFGKMALKSNTRDDSPIKKNMPTSKGFIVKEDGGNVEQQKKIWVSLIEEYEHYSNPVFIHDFFGKMTAEQVGIFAYKHADHHLRQFGA